MKTNVPVVLAYKDILSVTCPAVSDDHSAYFWWKKSIQKFSLKKMFQASSLREVKFYIYLQSQMFDPQLHDHYIWVFLDYIDVVSCLCLGDELIP